MSEILPIKVPPEMKIHVLSEDKIEKIHQTTLKVLEEVGIKFPSQKALEIFKDNGAKVDFKNEIVRIPEEVLMKSLSKAPKEYTMASSRNETELDLYLDGTKTFYGTDGTGTTTVDLKTREKRRSQKSDIEMMAIISDYLSSISFYWPVVSAQDMPSSIIPLHEIEASFNNTEKHVHIISCIEEEMAKYAVEMATIVRGSRRLLRERPPLSLLVCTVAPLAQDKGALEAALVFAEAGLPVGFMAMPTVASTSPASLASNIVVGNAEVLSALSLIQLAYPGAPVYYSYLPEMLNPHTGGIFDSAYQKPLLYAAGVDLGHYYNIPVMAYYGATGSKSPDRWITGKDNAIDALFVTLTGPDLLPSMGLLDAYTLLYPEKILFDDEIFRSIKNITEGILVNDNTLAYNEIREVGPGGHFLNREYTKTNLRRLWEVGITNQWSPEINDFTDFYKVAQEKINWILLNHKVKPLDDKIKIELKQIIKKAEKQFEQ